MIRIAVYYADWELAGVWEIQWDLEWLTESPQSLYINGDVYAHRPNHHEHPIGVQACYQIVNSYRGEMRRVTD